MAFLERGLIIYLFLAITVSMVAPDKIFTDGSPADSTVLSWFNIGYNGSDISMKSNLSGNAQLAQNDLITTQETSTKGGFTSILSLFDPIGQIVDWIGLFFKALFSPLILLTIPEMAGAPIAFTLMIILPIIFLVIVGIIFFIRGVG